MFRQRFGDHIPLIRRENVKISAEETGMAGSPTGREGTRNSGMMEMERAAFTRGGRPHVRRVHAQLLNKLADE